jgi:hypothetical protein
MATFRQVSDISFSPSGHRRTDAPRSKQNKSRRIGIGLFWALALSFGMHYASAIAAPTDYDGKWDFQDSCFAAGGMSSVEPFALQRTTTIEKGTFSDAYTGTLNGGKVEVSFIGTIKDSAITMFMDGKTASGVRWRETLDGRVASSTEILFDGTHFSLAKDKWVLTHTCFGKLRILEPASTPLSAPTAQPAPALASAPVAVPPASASGPANKAAPASFPGVSFDGIYSGPVTVSGLRSCGRTMARTISIVVKNNHFDTTVFNAGFSVDIPTSGILDATGERHADHAKTELTGRFNDWTIELEMQNPYCKAHANLKAANVTTDLAVAAIPARPAPPHRRRLAHTQNSGETPGPPPGQFPGNVEHNTTQPSEVPPGVFQR